MAVVYEARFVDELSGKPLDRELLGSFAASVEGVVLEVGGGPGHVGAFVQRRGPAVVGCVIARDDVAGVLREFHRVIAPNGALLFSAHEGEGVIRVDDFVGQAVPITATLFTLDELVALTERAGFDVVSAVRRDPYANEGSTVRLYVVGTRDA